MADFCPRLWGAIIDLIGDGRLSTRRHIGDKWILQFPRDRSLSSMALQSITGMRENTATKGFSDVYWHIDRPGLDSTIDYRIDALTLLIYWSDVEKDDGATLYSPGSLDGVLDAFEREPEGTDTFSNEFGLRAVCADDVRPFTGEPGDVVITHALSMHSASFNQTGALRILENPSIDVKVPLDYSSTNRSPSPAEQCIIRRLPKYPRLTERIETQVRQKKRMVNAARWLIHRHPDYFLPEQTAWLSRISAEDKARIHQVDAAIFQHWVRELFERSRNRTSSAKEKIEFGLYALCSRLIGHPGRTSPVAFENPERTDFQGTNTARLLRGFTSDAAFRHVMCAYLAQHGWKTLGFKAMDPTGQHESRVVVKIETDSGWCLLDTSARLGVFTCPSLFDGSTIEGIPRLSELRRSRRGNDPLTEAWLTAGHLVGPIEATSPPSGDDLELPSAAPTELSRPTPWQTFLLTRLDHLFFQCEVDDNPYTRLLRTGLFRGLTVEIIDRLRKDFNMGEKPNVVCEKWPSTSVEGGPGS